MRSPDWTASAPPPHPHQTLGELRIRHPVLGCVESQRIEKILLIAAGSKNRECGLPLRSLLREFRITDEG